MVKREKVEEIEFIPSINKCKYNTKGAKEWLSVLKQRWDLQYTTLREDDEHIVITHTRGGRHMVIVGEYVKNSGEGYVMDQRKEIRNVN